MGYDTVTEYIPEQEGDMKKTILAIGSVALSGCLLFAFAGCGTVNKAKSMKGEEVTEDVWDAAMAGTAYETETSVALPVQTVADETAEAPNYKAEFEIKMKYEFATEGGEIFGQTVEAMEANLEMNASSEVVIANNAMHFNMDYSVKVDGSENLLALMGMEEAVSEDGNVELYISFADPVGFFIKDGEGNWISASAAGDLSEMAETMYEACIGLLDQSALVGAFAEYSYSEEKKGYVAADGDLSASGGGASLNIGGELVYKIKNGKLGAIYSQASMNMAEEGMSGGMEAEVGLVYTYGGQSVTLPSVA